MNWVGGSRSRYIQNKEDTLKQRAFFQKQRMKSKSNNIGLPKAQNSGNMDLLTLFIVNQIASKKEPQSVQSNTGKTKINQMTGAKRTKKGFNEHFSNEFQMSPCLPSNLNLVTSLPKYSADTPGFKTRKYRLSEEFKFKPLSPVIESNLSDTSGSENQGQPSQASNVPPDPVKPKPTQHIPSSLPSSPDDMKLANPWPDVSNEAHMEDVPHSSPVVGIGYENTLLNQEMGEHSATSALYPLSPLKSSQQPEEPLFIDFKNTDCEVLASLTDRSQNIDNDGHFLKQEFVCTDSNSCADGGNVFMRAYESARGVYLSVDDTESQMHDGNPPIILDAGTQTEALTYCDVSVQCSLIHHSNSKSLPAAHQESGILTTRRRSFNLNPFLKLSSLIDGHKTIGNSSSGPSATNQQAQRHPRSQTGLSSRRLRRQKDMKREVTSVLKHSLPKASEQKKQLRWQ